MTDDYYEDDMLAKCPELGYTPHVEATEDEIMGEVMQHTGGAGRVPTGVARDLGPQASAFSLTPFYTLGGPTTHFAGSGSDPWTEAKWGHKRQKLRSLGVTEQDWLYRTAEETRRIDQQLRDYREERIVELEGSDATRGWVYASEQRTDGRAGLSKAAAARQDSVDSRLDEEPEESSGGLLKPPAPERRRSHLSQEVRLVGDLDAKASATVERAESAALTPLPGGVTPDDALGAAGGAASGGMIVVQTEEEERVMRAAHQWGLGMEWRAGVVKAAYEVGADLTGREERADGCSPTHTCHMFLFGLSLLLRPLPGSRRTLRLGQQAAVLCGKEPVGRLCEDWPAWSTSCSRTRTRPLGSRRCGTAPLWAERRIESADCGKSRLRWSGSRRCEGSETSHKKWCETVKDAFTGVIRPCM